LGDTERSEQYKETAFGWYDNIIKKTQSQTLIEAAKKDLEDLKTKPDTNCFVSFLGFG